MAMTVSLSQLKKIVNLDKSILRDLETVGCPQEAKLMIDEKEGIILSHKFRKNEVNVFLKGHGILILKDGTGTKQVFCNLDWFRVPEEGYKTALSKLFGIAN